MRTCLIAVAALMTAATASFAAEAPNMVGTWKPAVDHASARVGTSPGYVEPQDKPKLNTPEAWTLKIEAQDGRAFHGQAIGTNGKAQSLVGVFLSDGKRFHVSTETGAAVGEMTGDSFEYCWTDALPTVVAVYCGVYSK